MTQVLFPSGEWSPSEVTACTDCTKLDEMEQEMRQRIRAQEQAEAQLAARREKILELLEACGASPWDHGACTLDNWSPEYDGEAPRQAIRDFIAEVLAAGRYTPIDGSVYLEGPTGNGKTHLAVAAARELLLNPAIDPAGIVFDPADVLISQIRGMYGGRGDVEEFLQRRERAKVWILDDLGREPVHPDAIGHLTRLISQRGKRGTIITGNIDPDQYEERDRAGLARIRSRLAPAYFVTIAMRGPDWRFREAS